ncbi:hypothetical protein Dsin_018998 [Dipteronia sinensis]|uniref:Uncharacterized protein n=1 Tax=Dipteronia sinensis TaxID=43782 RepID=A0AAE0A6X4_9ROSI|nr:hypothetical protein Dsin_018998 [Dipteronia sinensis]
MQNSRDKSQPPHETGTPRGVNDTDVTSIGNARGDLPSRAPAFIGKNITTYTDAIPNISPDAFQQVQESVQRVIEDSARQGTNITATANLTSPFQLYTPVVARDPRIQSEIVVSTPDNWKSISVLSTLKQRNDKKLKDYPSRFSQEVSEVEDPNDDTVLRDYIEKLIRDGQLKNMVLKGGDARQNDPTKTDQDRKDSLRGSSVAGAINTIFGSPCTCRSSRERMYEVREAVDGQRNLEVNSVSPDEKKLKQVRISHREVRRVLIDNRISTDILNSRVFDQLGLRRKDLQPLAILLRGFGGAEVRSLGTIVHLISKLFL